MEVRKEIRAIRQKLREDLEEAIPSLLPTEDSPFEFVITPRILALTSEPP